jgi:opacity protein-like surface antigen
MENSLSMPELTALLVAKREKDYDDKKFFAAIQGIDLDKESGKNRGQKEWEDIKARVFSKGQTKDSDDVLSLQGANASKSGFGIGAGLEYASVKDSQNPKNPLKP